MEVQWAKLDSELTRIYSNFLKIKEKGKEHVSFIHQALQFSNEVSVVLQFKGNITQIEKSGFKTEWLEFNSMARGSFDLKNLPELANLDDVLKLEYGNEQDLFLDDSMPETLTRVTPPTGVWTVNNTNGVFSGTTGNSVVVGIIDSGIDYLHPVFLKTVAPTKQTRIFRIWDPGLVKTGAENQPNVARLQSAFTYGVEYTNAHINDNIMGKVGALPIRHKDCNGHGTHVASIAGGDGRAKEWLVANTEYKYVGAAPTVHIIVVKYFYLQNSPKEPNPPNNTISGTRRMEDAIKYILNTAKHELGDIPVVINYSGGSSIGPHDGLTSHEIWLKNTFAASTKQLFVTAAGNAAGKKVHAEVTIPASKELEIEFELFDTRTVKKDFNKCVDSDNTRWLFIDCWYKDISPNALSAALKVAGGVYTPIVNIGDSESGNYDGGKYYEIEHTEENVVTPAVKRNQVQVTIGPKSSNHKTGIYKIKFKANAGTKIHIWCYRAGLHGFKFKLPQTNVTPTDVSLVSSPAGASNILTVAAYDDSNGNIASFSSKGPLVDYAGIGTLPEKPDIGAPGVSIKAADSNFRFKNISLFPPDYIRKSGTSMAAPIAAGIAALLFAKNNTLTTAQIITHLKNHTRTALPITDFGKGKIDARKSFDNA